MVSEITFGDFAKLASRQNLTPECLAQRFAGKIDRMSSESGSKEDGSVMEDPSGCLADKNANLSTRPFRIRRGDHRIRDFPLKVIYSRVAPLSRECRADLCRLVSTRSPDSLKSRPST